MTQQITADYGRRYFLEICICNLHHPLPNLSDVGLRKVEGDAIQGAAAAHNACQRLQVHLRPTQQGKRKEGATTWRRHAAEDAAVVSVVLLWHAYVVVHGEEVRPAIRQRTLPL